MTLRIHPDEIVKQSRSPLLATHDTWERVRLGQVCEIKNGGTFSSAFFNTQAAGIPLIRIRDVGADESKTYYSGEYRDDYLVTPGDLVVGMDGDFKVARWHGQIALLNQRVSRLRVRDAQFYDNGFLSWVLQGYLDAVHVVTSAVTVKHLSSRTIQQLPLPLPPLEEQKRIVGHIESIFSRLDAVESMLTSLLDKLELLRSTILADAFHTNRDLPPGWKRASVGEVADVILGQSPPGSSYNGTGRGIPFFQGKAEFGALYPTVTKWTTEPRKLAKRGDILLSVRAPVGPTNVANIDCSIGRGLHALRSKRGMNRKFLLWAIRASAHRLQDVSTGSTFNAVTGKQVKSHKVPIAPFPQQQWIVTGIEELFVRLHPVGSILTSLLDRVDLLRSAVLAHAFAGRLVPQNPAEEPASALLERIAQSRSAKPKRQRVTA